MIVTLITDASFCSDTKAAGWAAWAKSERGKVQQSGHIEKPVGCNNEAEMCAIANGIHIALQASVLCRGDHLILQTDSHFAATRLSYRGRAKRLNHRDSLKGMSIPAKDVIQQYIAEHQIKLEIRLIAGHTRFETRDAKDTVMAWADKASRGRMKYRRSLLQKDLVQAID